MLVINVSVALALSARATAWARARAACGEPSTATRMLLNKRLPQAFGAQAALVRDEREAPAHICGVERHLDVDAVGLGGRGGGAGEVRREVLAGDLARRPPQRRHGSLRRLAASAAGIRAQEAVLVAGEQLSAQDRLERVRLDVRARARREHRR